jgi:hypothetical protein
MGAALTSILQGAGRFGNSFAESREIRRQRELDEQDRKLKLLQSQMGLQEVQQRLKTGAAPQFVASHEDPSGQLWNTERDVFSGKLTDLPGGKTAPKGVWKQVLNEHGDFMLTNDVTKETVPMRDEKGEVVRGWPKGRSGPVTTAAQKPVGVFRGGKAYTPADAGWTPDMQSELDQYEKGWTEAQTVLTERVMKSATARATAWLEMPIWAFDTQTGTMVGVKRKDVVNSPGRYSAPTEAQQMLNRRSLFTEIDSTGRLVSDAISRLPNDAFDAEARAQIAYVLRDPASPLSAWDSFKTSTVAKTLSPEQMEYVIDLVSLAESALSLRTLGGMGQGSDQLRTAIVRMLPGAGTPSREWAEKQMSVFNVEVNALRRSLPSLGSPGRTGIPGDNSGGTGKGTQDDPIVIP